MHIIDRYLFDEYDTQYGYDIIQLWICMGDSYHPKIIKPILTCATVKLHGSHGINRGGGHTSLWKWIDDPSCEHGTYKVYICAYIYIHISYNHIYIYICERRTRLLLATEMAKVGGPLLVLKVCSSTLCAKIGYREVGGTPISCEGFNTNLNIPSPIWANFVGHSYDIYLWLMDIYGHLIIQHGNPSQPDTE